MTWVPSSSLKKTLNLNLLYPKIRTDEKNAQKVISATQPPLYMIKCCSGFLISPIFILFNPFLTLLLSSVRGCSVLGEFRVFCRRICFPHRVTVAHHQNKHLLRAGMEVRGDSRIGPDSTTTQKKMEFHKTERTACAGSCLQGCVRLWDRLPGWLATNRSAHEKGRSCD